MEWLQASLYGLAFLAVGLTVIARAKPRTCSISRSALINVPAAEVFALINDFQSWSKWAPMDREDPGMTRSYLGAYYGVGAMTEWRGEWSSGKALITRSIADKEIEIQIEFQKPVDCRCVSLFQLTTQLNATLLTWSVRSDRGLWSRLFGSSVETERAATKQLEVGLADLCEVLNSHCSFSR